MMLAAAMEMVDVVRSPKLDAPQATPRRPLEGERDYPEQGQAPPAPPPPPPGEPRLGAAPEHPLVHGGAPAEGPPPREAKFGARGGKRRWGAGSSGGPGGPAASRQGTHPPPSDSLLGS